MPRIYILFLLIFPLVQAIQAQQLSAQEILDRSIAFHDPEGEWSTLQAELTFAETRPGGPDRKTVAVINNLEGSFRLNRNDQEAYQVNGDECVVERGEGTCERARMMRNYYLYLWGLPMKLKDPGTRLDEAYTEEILDGVECYVLRVPYEKDIWYFYMSKDNYAMVAYKFYKDEAAGKGEHIPTEGLFRIGSMQIPNNRTWYELPGNRVLGTDILKSAK